MGGPPLNCSCEVLPVGVAVSVVITEQVVFAHHFVLGDFKRLIHGGEQVLTQTGHLETAQEARRHCRDKGVLIKKRKVSQSYKDTILQVDGGSSVKKTRATV